MRCVDAPGCALRPSVVWFLGDETFSASARRNDTPPPPTPLLKAGDDLLCAGGRKGVRMGAGSGCGVLFVSWRCHPQHLLTPVVVSRSPSFIRWIVCVSAAVRAAPPVCVLLNYTPDPGSLI